ncbi:MAG TPA: hypothetical protein VJ302_04060 [Blastocatellia bacterium]|nr:hypothetical protein [Blastocatellia bacterium]
MTVDDLATLIRSVCHTAGEKRGIEFHPQAVWGAQPAGRWEVGYRLRRQGHSTVTLSYWFNEDSLLREEIILPWAFPPTPEEGEQFKNDITAKLDQMFKWL